MADYRLYLLDAGGHIQSAIPLVRDTDEQALDAAAQCPNAHGAELWQQERRICTFGPKPSAGPESPPPTLIVTASPQSRTSDAA